MAMSAREKDLVYPKARSVIAAEGPERLEELPTAERPGPGAAARDRAPGGAPGQLVPDLEISIGLGWREHEKRIEYHLSAFDPGLELNKEPFASDPLRSEPRAYLADLFGAVESLRLDSADDREIAALKMESKGADLLQKLVPRDLQRKLWSLRDRVATVLVQTDEETTPIPWELLRLRDADGVGDDGPFLCEAFELTRWLPRVPWVTRFPLGRPALVAPSSSGLKSASRERDDLRDLLGRHGRLAEYVPAQFRALRRHLASGVHGSWHFTGHGLARETQDADQWQLGLDGKEPFRPEDLQAGVLRTVKPLVFLNACRTGRHGLSLTAVGGWSSRFLTAGAGAFVGCHWSVPDDRAAEFAVDFYRRFLEGAPLGRAMREARLELRRRHAGDPTWLAYTLFAHPLAAVASAETVPARRGAAAAPGARTSRGSDSTSALPLGEPAAPAAPEEAPPPPAPPDPGPRAGEERVHEPDGTVLLHVPGGEYTIGDRDLEWSRPPHRVLLSPYWIGKHPVTNRQYARFLAASPDQPRPEAWDDPRFNRPEQPVVGVSWHEAIAYCRWASLSLPSEAQWEAAARGTDERRYPWGGSSPDARRANFGNRVGTPSEVGGHPAGAGPFGTLDQAGNVWEWCLDGWSLDPYRGREDRALDPVVEGDPSVRAVRGGSWANPPCDLACALRNRSTAKQRVNDQGFRCVLVPP